jgi:8-amino-7-oxononanoate synthase
MPDANPKKVRLADNIDQGTSLHAHVETSAPPKSCANGLCQGTASAVPNATVKSGALAPEVSPSGTVSDLRARIAADLETLRDNSQFRSLNVPSGINLCSNDYLGLAHDPRLKHAVLAALESSPQIASSGSRLLSGNSRDWQRLESEFADFAHVESALYFSSGYSANVGLLSCVLQPGDFVFSDALNHASIIDGIRLSRAQKIIYPHRDLYFLERALRENQNASGAKLIVTESVFSMEGDIAPLAEILGLAEKYNAHLVVDEAHALGVFGAQGRGLAAELPSRDRLLASVYPCGKALAGIGAFVCGSRALTEFLVNHARSFIFTTATPPYIAHQIRAAIALIRAADDRRAHLQTLAATLRAELSAAGISSGGSASQIIPVILGSNEAALHVAAQLQSAGFAVKAIRPPTVSPGAARIRLSLTSELSLEQIHRLARAVIEAVPASATTSAAPAHA